MLALPSLNGEEVVQIFKNFGWSVARQKGSHIILTNSVPNHKTSSIFAGESTISQ